MLNWKKMPSFRCYQPSLSWLLNTHLIMACLSCEVFMAQSMPKAEDVVLFILPLSEFWMQRLQLCKKTFLGKKKKESFISRIWFSLWNMVFSRHAWDDVNTPRLWLSPTHSALWLTRFWAGDTLPAGPDMVEPPHEGLRLSACLLNEIKNLSWISQSS